LGDVWNLCRYRHKLHYAEQRIMPSWDGEPLWIRDFAVMQSA
jgi:hypothetical protein